MRDTIRNKVKFSNACWGAGRALPQDWQKPGANLSSVYNTVYVFSGRRS